MKYKRLGRTGCEVSRLCLGTMNFGAITSEEDSFRMMDLALDMGINFFDTANGYGGAPGVTEGIIGRWLAQGGGRREQIVLATKVWTRMGEGPNLGFGVSAYKIKTQVEDSLRRLQTDRIDLYQMHYVDRAVTWEETWGAFEDLIQLGKVIYVGSSNHAAWDIATAQGYARQRGFLGFVSEQLHYSLISRDAEREVFPCCRAHGIGLLTYGALNSGLLCGLEARREKKGVRRQEEHVDQLEQLHREKLVAYEDFCRELGEAPADIAIAWQLHNPLITCPIIGPRTVDQLRTLQRVLDITLDASALEKLDEIFPSPGQYAADLVP